MNQFAEKVHAQPGVLNTMSLSGLDILGGGTKPNAGAMFIGLDTWDKRKKPELQLEAQIGQTFMNGAQLPEGTVIAFSPPSLPGLGMVGGFTLMLQDRSGGSLADLDNMSQKLVEAAKECPEIASIMSTFKANTPSYEFEVDRDKAKQLGSRY